MIGREMKGKKIEMEAADQPKTVAVEAIGITVGIIGGIIRTLNDVVSNLTGNDDRILQVQRLIAILELTKDNYCYISPRNFDIVDRSLTSCTKRANKLYKKVSSGIMRRLKAQLPFPSFDKKIDKLGTEIREIRNILKSERQAYNIQATQYARPALHHPVADNHYAIPYGHAVGYGAPAHCYGMNNYGVNGQAALAYPVRAPSLYPPAPAPYHGMNNNGIDGHAPLAYPVKAPSLYPPAPYYEMHNNGVTSQAPLAYPVMAPSLYPPAPAPYYGMYNNGVNGQALAYPVMPLYGDPLVHAPH